MTGKGRAVHKCVDKRLVCTEFFSLKAMKACAGLGPYFLIGTVEQRDERLFTDRTKACGTKICGTYFSSAHLLTLCARNATISQRARFFHEQRCQAGLTGADSRHLGLQGSHHSFHKRS